MKPTCEIVFNEKSEEVKAGDVVSGHVVVENSSSFRTKGIFIHCIGKCTTGHPFLHCTHKDETYIESETRAWLAEGDKVGAFGDEFKAGKHEFPFEFRVPDDAPSSFGGKYGWINYYIEVVIDRIFSLCHYRYKKEFFVSHEGKIAKDDVPNENEATVEKAPSIFNKKDDFKMTVKLDKCLYQSDEEVKVKVSIDNKTCFVVTAIRAKIVEEATFESNSLIHKHMVTYNDSAEEVGEVHYEGPGEFEWDGALLVPDLEPSGLKGCSLIGLNYHLQVQAHLNCFGSVDLRMPIVVNCEETLLEKIVAAVKGETST